MAERPAAGVDERLHDTEVPDPSVSLTTYMKLSLLFTKAVTKISGIKFGLADYYNYSISNYS